MGVPGLAAATLLTATHGLKLMSTRDLDVLLVDPALRDADGIGFIRRCRALQRACEIVVVTVFESEQLVRSAFTAGAAGYLLKYRKDCWSAALPCRIADSLQSLRDGGVPVSPAIAGRLRAFFQSEGSRIESQTTHGPPTPASGFASASCGGEVTLLSTREVEVLRLASKGMNDAQIGALLSISAYTVGTHVKNIYRKLDVHSRTEAVYEARHLRLIRD